MGGGGAQVWPEGQVLVGRGCGALWDPGCLDLGRGSSWQPRAAGVTSRPQRSAAYKRAGVALGRQCPVRGVALVLLETGGLRCQRRAFRPHFRRN